MVTETQIDEEILEIGNFLLFLQCPGSLSGGTLVVSVILVIIALGPVPGCLRAWVLQ